MTDKPPAGLGDLIGYQLQLTHLATLRDARAALAAQRTTPARVTALTFIRDHPGCDQSALGRFLDVNRSSAMKLVNALGDQLLIERRDGRDRRSNGLYLTAFGEQSLTAMIATLAAADARLVESLTLPERRELLRLLAKVRDAEAHEDQPKLAGVAR